MKQQLFLLAIPLPVPSSKYFQNHHVYFLSNRRPPRWGSASPWYPFNVLKRQRMGRSRTRCGAIWGHNPGCLDSHFDNHIWDNLNPCYCVACLLVSYVLISEYSVMGAGVCWCAWYWCMCWCCGVVCMWAWCCVPLCGGAVRRGYYPGVFGRGAI